MTWLPNADKPTDDDASTVSPDSDDDKVDSSSAAEVQGLLRIASINIFSIQAKLERLVCWTHDNDIDVLCVQETLLDSAMHKRVRAAFFAKGYTVFFSDVEFANGRKGVMGGLLTACRRPCVGIKVPGFRNSYRYQATQVLRGGDLSPMTVSNIHLKGDDDLEQKEVFLAECTTFAA